MEPPAESLALLSVALGVSVVGASQLCLHLIGWKKRKGLSSGAAYLVGMGLASAGTSFLALADGI